MGTILILITLLMLGSAGSYGDEPALWRSEDRAGPTGPCHRTPPAATHTDLAATAAADTTELGPRAQVFLGLYPPYELMSIARSGEGASVHGVLRDLRGFVLEFCWDGDRVSLGARCGFAGASPQRCGGRNEQILIEVLRFCVNLEFKIEDQERAIHAAYNDPERLRSISERQQRALLTLQLIYMLEGRMHGFAPPN